MNSDLIKIRKGLFYLILFIIFFQIIFGQIKDNFDFGTLETESSTIDVDDRISECAHAKNCFNDLCELEIDREAYDSQLKYCYSILAECRKLMEEYQIP